MHSTQGRYKLRVNFVSTDAYGQDTDTFPYRKLLYLARSDQQVGEVRQDISRLYHRIHPSDHSHQVACLRDSQMFDVPDDYLVSEVFDECPEIYAALTGLCLLPAAEETDGLVGSSSASTVGGIKRKRYVLVDNTESEVVRRLKTDELPFAMAVSKQAAVQAGDSEDDEELTLTSMPTEEAVEPTHLKPDLAKDVPKPIPSKQIAVAESAASKSAEAKEAPKLTIPSKQTEAVEEGPKQTEKVKEVPKPTVHKPVEVKEVPKQTEKIKEAPKQTEEIKELPKPTHPPKHTVAPEPAVPSKQTDVNATSDITSKLESLAEEMGDTKKKEKEASSSSEEEEDSSSESSSEEETTSSEEEESETEDDILKSLRVLKDKMDHKEPPVVIKKEDEPVTVKKQRPPALDLPKNTRRQSGVLELAKSQKNSPAGIMSISQMASAKPYDELRKKMAIQAASRSAKSNPTTPVAHITKKEVESSEEEEGSSSDSDSDSSEEDKDDDKTKTPAKKPPPMPNGLGKPKGKPIRFANGKLPADTAKTKKSSLLNL